MTAASSDRYEPSRRAQGKDIIRAVVRDFVAVAILALLCLAAGQVMNHFSIVPLPLVYQTPEQRFDAQLAALVTAPPFKIAPAATVGLPEFRSAVENKSALILDARPRVFFERGH